MNFFLKKFFLKQQQSSNISSKTKISLVFWYFFPEETRHLQFFIKFFSIFFCHSTKMHHPKKEKPLPCIMVLPNLTLFFVLFSWLCHFWLHHKIRKIKEKKFTGCGLVLSLHGKHEEEDYDDDDDDVVVSVWDLKKEVENLEGWVFAFHESNKKKLCWWSFVQKNLGFLFETTLRC